MGGSVYTPKQQNWRWYQDDAAEPSTALANENTKPTLANNFDKIRLRVCIAETGGKADNAVTISVEYSTNDSTFTAVGPSGQFNYADGQATEGNTVTTNKLTDATTKNEYCESGSNVVAIGASTTNELDICLVPNSPSTSTTYYFRIVGDGVVIPLNTGETHPQVLTSAAPTYRDYSGTLAIVSSAPDIAANRYASYAGTAAPVLATNTPDMMRYLPFAGTAALALATNTPVMDLLSAWKDFAGTLNMVSATNTPALIITNKLFSGTAAMVTATGRAAIPIGSISDDIGEICMTIGDFAEGVALCNVYSVPKTYKDYLGTSALVTSIANFALSRTPNFSGAATLLSSTPAINLARIMLLSGAAAVASGTNTPVLNRYAGYAGASALATSAPNISLGRIMLLSGTAALVVNIPDYTLDVNIADLYKDFLGTSALVSATGTVPLNRYAEYQGASGLYTTDSNIDLGRYVAFVGTAGLVTNTGNINLGRILLLSGASALTSATNTPVLNRIAGFQGTSALVTAVSLPALLRYAELQGIAALDSETSLAELLRILGLTGTAVLIVSTSDIAVEGGVEIDEGTYITMFRRRKREQGKLYKLRS